MQVAYHTPVGGVAPTLTTLRQEVKAWHESTSRQDWKGCCKFRELSMLPGPSKLVKWRYRAQGAAKMHRTRLDRGPPVRCRGGAFCRTRRVAAAGVLGD